MSLVYTLVTSLTEFPQSLGPTILFAIIVPRLLDVYQVIANEQVNP